MVVLGQEIRTELHEAGKSRGLCQKVYDCKPLQPTISRRIFPASSNYQRYATVTRY
ncbi:MAG: hypothetical protein KatS3mg130_0773 [Candidatus Sumerlaea sp.]|nr:MAG: hypothetical protein KatS3mg130_0773 [Candidatus Sumerlaea sp.]